MKDRRPLSITDLLMARLFLCALSNDLHSLLLCHWLDVCSLVRLDIAVSSATSRPHWMTLLGSLRSASIDNMDHNSSSLMWLIQRGICPTRVQRKDDGWRVPGCNLSLLKTTNLLHLGLRGCSRVTDECILKALMGRCNNVIEETDECKMGRDADVSALSHSCRKLESIDLARCDKVTDAGVSALAAGCGQLQSINLANFDKVTDAGVSALAAGCGQLQRINLENCQNVTDVGVSALSQ